MKPRYVLKGKRNLGEYKGNFGIFDEYMGIILGLFGEYLGKYFYGFRIQKSEEDNGKKN
jgi:hypothetical protein